MGKKISQLGLDAAPLGANLIASQAGAGKAKRSTLASLPISDATQAALDAIVAAAGLSTSSIDSLAKLNALVLDATLVDSASTQPLDSDLTAIAALSTTSFGRALLALADAAALRTAAGLETVGQAEAEAGAATTERAWTAERVGQAIAALGAGAAAASETVAGISELATIAEVDTGTDTGRTITPAGLAGSALQSTADSAVQPTASQTLTNKDITASSNIFPSTLENIVNEALTASQFWSALGAGAGESTGTGLVVFGTDPSITGTNITGTAAGLTVGATTGVEAGADVTDTANVTAAGALMDSEVTNLAQVKAFDSSDYATAAQGTLADAAAPKAIYIEKHAASHTIDASECYGGVHYVTAAATITLPAAVDGMSVTIITVGAVAVSVDPNASDLIMLDGVALDDGDKIANLSTSGDIAVLTYYDATGWYAATNSWTDGGV